MFRVSGVGGWRTLAALAGFGAAMASQDAAAVTVLDNYWGGKDTHNYGDSIGGGIFNIAGATITRTGPGNSSLQIAISTAYAGAPGTPAAFGTGYGALFITPGVNVWNPTGTAADHYHSDVYVPGQWTYAFTMPKNPGATTGAGGLYAVSTGAVELANVAGSFVSGSNGWIFREGQAVQFTPGATPALAGGSWAVDVAHQLITFTINDNHLLGNDFAMAWAMDCGNDVLQAQVSAVPEPSTWAMMLIGFAGLGVAYRRRSATSRAA